MLLPLPAALVRRRPIRFDAWRSRPTSGDRPIVASWPLDRYGHVVPAGTRGGDAAAAFERLRDAILALRLFPPDRIALWADTMDGRAAEGATVVQRIVVAGFAIESAVRITEVRDDPDRVAVTWVTVAGHPEIGVETFSGVARPDGSIDIRISARSRPGPWVVRLLSPITRRLQIRMSHVALRHLAAAAIGGSGT